jgi:hypothetical protein
LPELPDDTVSANARQSGAGTRDSAAVDAPDAGEDEDADMEEISGADDEYEQERAENIR